MEEKTGQIIEVIELTKDNITFSGNFEKEWQATAIPLTKSTCIRLGFIKDDEGVYDGYYLSYQAGNNIQVTIDPKTMEVGIALQWRAEGTGIFGECKYVHQLQNLIFALTGEDLKLKS
ncbi:hypothetical protein [Pedobacter lusitanus]|nr:hypothetical protein [Pedobacter lusitanus]